MQECAFVEKLRHKRNLATIAELAELCNIDSLGYNDYRPRKTRELPLMTWRLYVKERAENGPTD